MSQGLFITIEGVEGCGKSTQREKLAQWFESQGRTVVCTREPGGSEIGGRLRELILSPGAPIKHQYTEIFLFYADRLEHIHQVVQPALNRGDVVICDRYVDSTYAYQVGGRQIPRELVDQLNQWIEVMPHWTVLLDIDPEEGIRRAKKRAALDRFEQEHMEFHERVRSEYLHRAQDCADRIIPIDVNQLTVDEVFEQIIHALAPVCKEH